MKNFSLALISLLLLNSCDDFKEKSIKKEVFAQDYKKYYAKKELIILDLDTIKNFSELRREMEEIACDKKISGLKFKFNKINYHITGFAECPSSAGGCYFYKNTLMIKNDSIGLDFKNKVSIKNLKNEIDSIISKPYNFQHNKNILNPALIYLYIDDKYKISKTKEVLAEILEQFNNINTANSPDFFEYNIIFESDIFFTIPPPPPPPLIDIK
ncbi:hypothetical protein FF125_13180 [Aureibaculum algae]|uniref:Uncharacterized protein n=1 Tax=Aureibaculum algae TaxID=2584122 RepID=A0A5B7TVM3_9FLAO|nr:hypothetical protein [Aureibaculum algae]QCX39344.1 hypothetical protein FF125_13180 [Aureibaculum algae]